MSKSPEIGVDTLHLNPVEWQITDDFAAQIQPARYDSGTLETTGNFPLFTTCGSTHSGAKALRLEEHFALELNPFVDRKTGVSHVSAKVTLTVPKLHNADNYHPAGHKETRDALRIVNRELAEIGFKTNLESAFVARLDACKTINADDSWRAYRPVFERFQPSRMKGVGFDTGLRWGNTQHQVVLYDKLEELKANSPKADFSRYPKNSIRAEKRWLKRDKFATFTGIKTAGELVSGFDHLRTCYRDAMEKELFKSQFSEREALSVEATAAEMLYFIKSERYWFEAWKDADWIANRVIDSHRLEVIKTALQQASEAAGLSPKTIREKRAKLDALFTSAARHQTGKSKRTMADLYREIQEKVLS